MSLSFVALAGLTTSLCALGLLVRRQERRRTAQTLEALEEAEKRGSHKARLQFPHIDISRCLGCGTCIRACPEDGVIDLLNGQAAVIHGARCVGHGACARECPVNAITLTLGDIEKRDDIPALRSTLEVAGVPGLYLAGEVTGHALIKTAILHGTAVVDEVAGRLEEGATGAGAEDDRLDLCVVGAGPAGLSAALQSKVRGLRCAVLEQDVLGGTVAKYPRRKLVMTQPVSLPLVGRLKRSTYTKEELMAMWESITAEHELDIRYGETLTGIERRGDDFEVTTVHGTVRARNVCLALGRRGTPRKLGVPGEERTKVAYSLLDAQSYRGRRVLVVGGGDSAVEAALALAEQEGNEVTLSYRREGFFRIKARNEERLDAATREGRITLALNSRVTRIDEHEVEIEQEGEARTIPNDDVFILAGGIPPFELLKSCGVSFDPADREAPEPLTAQGTGLLKGIVASAVFTILALIWSRLHAGYYDLPDVARPDSPLHLMLRPSSPFGLTCGALGTLMIFINLAYLPRRYLPPEWIPGSLQAWMTTHVATGFLALLLIFLHGAMLPRDTLGGHAFLALITLVLTGAIGRYFYSVVPRATNGRELTSRELSRRLATEMTDWDRHGREFGTGLHEEIEDLVSAHRWESHFFQRVWSYWTVGREARRVFRRVEQEAREQGLTAGQRERLLELCRRTFRTTLAASHLDDLRAILASWRFFHRWVALLMVLLALVHIRVALKFLAAGV